MQIYDLISEDKNAEIKPPIMEKIAELEKDKYEEISLRNDPRYDESLRAIEIIKQFIKERKLVIYGGTAIDYALRLFGDNIYPDEALAIPDLDFYSSDNVKDSYDLAEILYKAGFDDVRTIRATFVKTMRVDTGDNHFLADITYMPKKLFDNLPVLEYEGMRIIHPTYQRMDLHIGLTYLFDGPPREAIFARWKFIKRLNKLDKHYPIMDSAKKGASGGGSVNNNDIIGGVNDNTSTATTIYTLPYSYTKYVFSGVSAYAIMIKFVKMVEAELTPRMKPATKEFCAKQWKKVIMLRAEIEGYRDSGVIKIEAIDGVEFIHPDIDLFAEENGLIERQKYADVGSFPPKRMFGIDKSISSRPCPINVYSSKGKLTSIGSIKKSALGAVEKDGEVQSLTRFTCSQYILAHFVAMWLAKKEEIYLKLYDSMMTLAGIMEGIVADVFADYLSNGEDDHTHEIKKYILENPVLISTKAYGDSNISETSIVILKNQAKDMGIPGVDIPPTPGNYYPSRGRQRSTPDFNYEESEFFIKDGRKL